MEVSLLDVVVVTGVKQSQLFVPRLKSGLGLEFDNISLLSKSEGGAREIDSACKKAKFLPKT